MLNIHAGLCFPRGIEKIVKVATANQIPFSFPEWHWAIQSFRGITDRGPIIDHVCHGIHSSNSPYRLNMEQIKVMFKNHIYRKLFCFVDHVNNKVLQGENIWASVIQPAFVQVTFAFLGKCSVLKI